MPALDEDTWIVVPFDNLAKAADADWLRGASVNLLYLDMSRWKDIRVIDDERVADLMRETPEAAAAGSAALSLNAGIAVAKRAGAGKLVMGDVLKLGNRTTVTAKVFDVKTGQRMRSVKEDALVQDSVMPLFGKLAQKILDVAPPAGANVGALGTTRTDAYQEYLAGITALNAFDLPGARRRLQRAIALDSSFALAHYKMAIVLGWDEPNNPLQRTHAETALRNQSSLPARVRGLIAGTVHQSKNEWSKACEVFSGLVRSDSTDVEAWYGLGECLYHDPLAEAVGGDTTRLRLNANHQGAIRAFTRVLELDPQYHLAYQHIIDALVAERQQPRAYCPERCRTLMVMNVRIGDSLAATPVFVSDTAAVRAQVALYQQTRSKQRNLAAARQVAEQWVTAAPSESRSQTALGGVMMLQGEFANAEAALGRARESNLIHQVQRTFMRMDVAYRQGKTAEAARLYDSLRALTVTIPGNSFRLGNTISGYGPPFGRVIEWDSIFTASLRLNNAPAEVAPYQRRSARIVLGVPPDDSVVHFERLLFDLTRQNRGAAAATRQISATLAYALRMPRAQWPALDTTVTDIKIRPAIAMMRGDTAALRRAAQALDSTLQAIATNSFGSDTGYAQAAAEAYLALGDSTAALRVVRLSLEGAAAATQYFPNNSQGYTAAFFAPRSMLLRADLAAARGQNAEAREWYRRFIDAWSGAPAEMQVIVERARRARAALPQ